MRLPIPERIVPRPILVQRNIRVELKFDKAASASFGFGKRHEVTTYTLPLSRWSDSNGVDEEMVLA